jgi:hypothetical protein
MKNVLVNREKWKKLESYVRHWKNYGDSIAYDILAMPDFVESEEDVDHIATLACKESEGMSLTLHRTIHTAINALKIKGGVMSEKTNPKHYVKDEYMSGSKSIEETKREAYNQAIEDAAAICRSVSYIGFNFSDNGALREKSALECYEEIKELEK